MGKNNMTPEQMIVKAMRLNIIAMALIILNSIFLLWIVYG